MSFRKTVATLLDREADTKTAAAQLGHQSEEITTAYYIQKAHLAPDTSAVLNALGPDSKVPDTGSAGESRTAAIR